MFIVTGKSPKEKKVQVQKLLHPLLLKKKGKILFRRRQTRIPRLHWGWCRNGDWRKANHQTWTLESDWWKIFSWRFRWWQLWRSRGKWCRSNQLGKRGRSPTWWQRSFFRWSIKWIKWSTVGRFSWTNLSSPAPRKHHRRLGALRIGNNQLSRQNAFRRNARPTTKPRITRAMINSMPSSISAPTSPSQVILDRAQNLENVLRPKTPIVPEAVTVDPRVQLFPKTPKRSARNENNMTDYRHLHLCGKRKPLLTIYRKQL